MARKFVLDGIKQQPDDVTPKFSKEDVGEVIITRFAQTEPLVILEGDLNGRDVIFFFSYEGRIDERATELRLAMDIAKKRGADRITVVAMYTPYSRGDKRDQHHSSAALKVFIDSCINMYGACYITCDLHNVATIEFVDGPAYMLTLRKVMMSEVKRSGEVTVSIAADAGGVKRMRKWAETLYIDENRYLAKGVVDKMRAGNDDSAMSDAVYGTDVAGQDVLIVDDEAMTLGTLVSAAKVLKEAGARTVRAMAYHGILVGKAIDKLVESPITELVVTNTVPVPRSKIRRAGGKLRVVDVSGFAVEAARKWYGCESLSTMIDYAYDFK
ncbi:ribose-phosphate diphosphokinase [Candidatus Saccharibacteria bacterium]|nr:ribose-phosphate diphosphokinase [Candidatus Saccharibacteria bacterium]